jgi:hypothetical protein
LNIPDDTIAQLRLEALRLDTNNTAEVRSIIPKFDERALPMDSVLITTLLDNPPEKLIPVLEYMVNRKLFPEDFPFYWTPKVGFSNRLIIPFYKDGVCVGYTARAINSEANPRYLSEQQPGYVFNLDRQQPPPWDEDNEFVIVCEGPFDALSINGCALLGAEIKDSQNWLLKQLGKELILVPDRDEAGKATLEQAIDYGWSVSMPDWPEGVKDINDAVIKLGRLATLWLIVSAKESNNLKIQLRAKKWFKDNENIV